MMDVEVKSLKVKRPQWNYFPIATNHDRPRSTSQSRTFVFLRALIASNTTIKIFCNMRKNTDASRCLLLGLIRHRLLSIATLKRKRDDIMATFDPAWTSLVLFISISPVRFHFILPVAQRAMKVWTCFRISASLSSGSGSLLTMCSMKSFGVTAAKFHFNFPKTTSSHS